MKRIALGQVVATPGAIETMERLGIEPGQLLARHARGDWGDLCPEDRQANDHAVGRELRILSSYKVGGDEKLWVITESDRSATTILTPEEY